MKSPFIGPIWKPAGILPQFEEKSIGQQFLGQFFGEGLGYQVKTTSPDDWQMEHEFHVQ